MHTKSLKTQRNIRRQKRKPNEQCAKQLIKIQPHITAEDRKKAITDFRVSYVTVSRYLNGQVSNLVLGMGLLNFFIKRINQRTADLLSLSSGKSVD